MTEASATPRAVILVVVIASLCLVVESVGWAQKPSGIVAVVYAGSLGAFVDKGLTPVVERTTGYSVRGEGYGPVAAARMIRDRLPFELSSTHFSGHNGSSSRSAETFDNP